MKILKIVSLVAVLALIAMGIFAIKASYQYEAIIESMWSLADKSSTIPAKAQYVDRFVDALDQQGFGGKYNAIIFPTPDNSYDQNYAALKTLQSRLHEIATMDITSFQYQTAIQQITAQEQGEAHKMLNVFEGVWRKEHYPFLWNWIGGTFLFILIIAALPWPVMRMNEWIEWIG
jgi:hypothetical protein